MTGLDKIILQYEKTSEIEVHGFYRTQDGRNFLRELFGPFLNRVRFREGKVASIIADHKPNQDAQTREVDSTKNAIRRWYKEGQAELWLKDNEKNLRLMARLENEMMANDEIATVLSDQAASVRKIQTGEAFSRFFYGEVAVRGVVQDVAYAHAQLEGLYESYGTTFIEADTGSEMSGLFGKSESRYYYLKRIVDRNFMLVHSFRFAPGLHQNENRVRLSDVRSGYGFSLDDGSFHCLLGAHGPPHSRFYDVYTPITRDHVPVQWQKKSDDILRTWSHSSRPFQPVAGFVAATAGGERDPMPFDETRMWAKPLLLDKKIHNYLDKILWNVII